MTLSNHVKESDAVMVVNALAQRSRLAILWYLIRRGHSGASAGRIGERLEVHSSTLSFHFNGLREAGCRCKASESLDHYTTLERAFASHARSPRCGRPKRDPIHCLSRPTEVGKENSMSTGDICSQMSPVLPVSRTMLRGRSFRFSTEAP
jgi:Helix-turn-helix domain